MDFTQVMSAVDQASALLGLITGMAFVGAPLLFFFQSKLGRVRRAEAATREALNEEIERKDIYIAELEETAAKPFMDDLVQAGRGVLERGAVAEEWLHRLSPTLITAYTAMADARHAEGDGAYHLRRAKVAMMGAVAATGGQEGESTRRLAELDEAIEAADLRETAQGLDRDVDALARNTRAAYENGDYRRAVTLGQKVLELRIAATGEDSLQTAEAANNLGVVTGAAGMSDQAEQHLRKALDIRERVLGPDHPDTAQSYNNVSSNLHAQGRASDAEPLLRKALDIRERVLGPDHPDTARSYNNVSSNLHAQGRASDAEPLLRKALDIRERVLGPDHPDTASSYNNVAFNLGAQGRAPDAEPLYRKALDINERVFGPDHPDTATSYNNVAFNLDAQGKASEAEPLYRKALDIRERVLGPDHPDTARSYNNVAFNLDAQGRASDAEPLYRKALDILERVLGSEHPNTKTVRANLEDCIRRQSQS